MISPDSPITTSGEDRLGRAKFAAALADTIVRFESDESFVIGIHGKWGTGKSSVMNLIVESLSAPKEEKVDILRFNPWNFADQSQLVLQFLRQFTAHLRRFEKTGKIKNLADNLDKYATALGPPLEAVPYGRVLAGGVKLVTRALGADSDTESLFKTVSEQLKSLKKKTLVIIDDIDRLTAGEIRQIFQLVKLSARFPYVIYLLAFDRNAVADALSDIGVQSGEEYLEKIVQVSFDLPPIDELGLTSMITEAIDNLLLTYQPAHFDRNRFENLLYSDIRGDFESLRDVRRFINGLEFGFGMIGREVNGVDFIGVEALRVFHPKVFEVIRRNKEIFAGHIDVFTSDKGHEAFKAEVDALFSAAEADVTPCRQLVLALFPKLGFAYSNMVVGSHAEEYWEKTFRVCASRYFDFYFRLVVPDADVTVAEIDKTVESTSSQLALQDNLDAYIKTNRIKNALSSFRRRLPSLSLNQLRNVLGAAVSIGDLVRQEGTLLAGNLPEFWYVRWTIFDCIDLLPPEQGVGLLKNICATTDGVGTAVAIISLLPQLKAEEPSKYAQYTTDVVDELKRSTVGRIEELASRGRLGKTAMLQAILTAWKTWGNEHAVRDYVAAAITTPRSLVRLLDQFIYQTSSASSGDKFVRIDNRLNIGGLAALADIDTIAKALEALDEGQLDDNGLAVVAVARKTLSEFKQSRLTPEQFQNRPPMP